ncbi:TadE/TadG family type IV pilus assembly protein [Limnobaculum xujianqingii]|uniref:TadE/TadG family type IV pilus assembly protein n=1 Tax=Limnobaculum xujianqingii TaxID=2738837 RepID=UPI001126A448|nr:TadE/TadG family type IV pilus assembly protein [Limnobaculum xujianqingii]
MINYSRIMFAINKKVPATLKEEKGAVAVEISLIFIPLIFIILLIFELCRIVYISSALDLAVAEASRYAAISTLTEEDYQAVFYRKLNTDIPFWPLLTRDENLYVDVNYCSTINDVITGNCDNNPDQKSLAIYNVGYHYTLLFSFMPTATLNSYLQRTVVYVQEYQRDNK